MFKEIQMRSPSGDSVKNTSSKPTKTIKVAIAGNPNAGKTSIFNSLTGQTQHVGNYPGVTVEKKIGYLIQDDWRIEFIDLPGTYSLSAFTLEEVVTRDYILLEKPDLVVDVLDSTNLDRNLNLMMQIQEIGVPVLGVLNMSDEADEKGIVINIEQLEKLLNTPFVKTIGNKKIGIRNLVDKIISHANEELIFISHVEHFNSKINYECTQIEDILNEDSAFSQVYNSKWMAIKLLEEDSDAIEKLEQGHKSAELVLSTATDMRLSIEKQFHEEPATVIVEQRYAFIHGVTRKAVKRVQTHQQRIDMTERVDRVVLNRYAGIFIFFGIMYLVYQFTFAIGNPLSDLVGAGFNELGDLVSKILPAGLFHDLIVDGIIGGVGGVLVFFPLVMLLFMGLSFLEDTGYLARAAFVMDKFFQIFGLHGRSFIPFMIATGCAVPAVMSARTLSSKRDRTITILVIPIMICGAKSPVIAMLAAAFFPEHAALIFWLVWFASWLIAVTIGLILTKTIFKEQIAPFVMELPPYRMPTFRSTFNHMWWKSKAYIRKAGTIILAASVIIWALLYFPKADPDILKAEVQGKLAQIDQSSMSSKELTIFKDNLTAKLELNYSLAGRIGHFIEPVMKPAGFDWRVSIGLFSGFAAKEVIISTMGIVYGIGEGDPSAEGDTQKRTPLKEAMANDPTYSPAMALAMMVFVMIYLPCMAVLAVVKKELGGWFWPIFQAVYTLFVAWSLAVVVYQVGTFFGL